jgi:probable HAF family extracellular repeat protein
MRTTIATAAITAVLLGLVATPAQADGLTEMGVRWDLNGTKTVLAQLPGSARSEPNALNDDNIVVGDAYLSVDGQEVYHAVRWDAAGKATDLGVLPGDLFSMAKAVNASGVVIGESHTAGYASSHAVRWAANGAMTQLASLPGADATYANAIADDGTVVGFSGDKPVKWLPDGTLVELPRLGAGYNAAQMITDSGLISGYSAGHLVRWSPEGTITDLGHSGDWSQAVAMADDGTIGGYSGTDMDGAPVDAWAQRWDLTGHPTKLRRPTGVSLAYATDMNNSHVVIGYAGTTDWKPVRWAANGSLTRLLDLGGQSTADAINDAGVIAGTSNDHVVRWSPGSKLTDLGIPAGYTRAGAVAINAGGSIIGSGWSY